MQEGILIKRIIEGVAYNTDTCTWIARSQWAHQDDRGREVHVMALLCQTTRGAYFLDKTSSLVGALRGSESRDREELIPMTVDEARAWMLKGEVEVIHDPFAEGIPEAELEAEQGATIYLRVPAAFKQQVEAAAKKEDLSINAWVMNTLRYEMMMQRSLEMRDARQAEAATAEQCRQNATAHREIAKITMDGSDGSPDEQTRLAHLAHLEIKKAEWWEAKAKEKESGRPKSVRVSVVRLDRPA
jgi:HicB family